MKKYYIFKMIPFAFLFLFILLLCRKSTFQNRNSNTNQKEIQKFYTYWKKGNAEITKYDLFQSRYQEIRKGYTIMVFVTEPFYKNTQVKVDNPSYNTKDNILTVLKLNKIERFQTGIYDYSIMTSTFTAIHPYHYNTKDISNYFLPYTLKITNSTQDWCGQSFLQINKYQNSYKYRQFSYFESEKDTQKTIPLATLTEDDIYTKIRISPKFLPVGKIKIVPSSKYIQIQHKKIKSYLAEAIKQPAVSITKDKFFAKDNIMAYSIFYPNLSRKLIIYYNQFPVHTIIGFQELTLDKDKKIIKNLSSTGKKTHSVITKYWNQNSLKDNSLRKKIGL